MWRWQWWVGLPVYPKEQISILDLDRYNVKCKDEYRRQIQRQIQGQIQRQLARCGDGNDGLGCQCTPLDTRMLQLRSPPGFWGVSLFQIHVFNHLAVSIVAASPNARVPWKWWILECLDYFMVLLKTELPRWRWRYIELLKLKCIFGEPTLAEVDNFDFGIFGIFFCS